MNSSRSLRFSLNPSIQTQKPFDLVSLFPDCPRKEYARNKALFTFLDVSNKIFFVISGKIKLTYLSEKGKAIGLNYYKSGDLINLETINQESNKRERKIALSKSKKTTILMISKENFLEKMNSVLEFQKYVFKQLLSAKTSAEKRVSNLLEIPSQQRVYDFLYGHTLKFGEKVEFEYVIRNPLTHQEISEYVGCARQTVTTSMNDLRREGIFDFNRKYWIIRNLEGLKNMVHQF